MTTKVNIFLTGLMLCAGLCAAQINPPPPRPVNTDSIVAAAMARQRPPDTIPLLGGPRTPASNINWDSVALSPDALDDQVDYQARDSMYFDIKNKKIYMFGATDVKFQTMNITADQDLIDWQDNTMTAEGRKDPANQWIGKPNFKEGDQNFTASKMKYNFKTYKGIIYEAQTMQEGLNIVGEKGKFFGSGSDTTQPYVIYNRNAIFSTCELEHPHFGIRSNKQKIVQDKVAVVGPCNLIIGDIPTPLWLPFGFFPLKSGRRTGLIFPQSYEYSESWGFGLENVGWYLPMSDNWDLTLTGDIYLKGTFRVHAATNYRKRYKFNGTAGVDVAYLRSEVKGRPVYNPSLGLRWNHSQDSKAHPYRTFGGNIQLQTSNYQKANQTDAQSQFQTSLSSNMSYRRRFDQPFDLSVAFNHSQNTNTRQMTINFPTINFQTQNLYPFKRKLKTGGERWYERIQMRYSSEARNSFTAIDSTLFTKQTLDDARFGIRQSVTTSTSFNLLKYFTVSPNASYKEIWYFNTLEKAFDPTLTIEYDTVYTDDSLEYSIIPDTTQYGKIVDNYDFGFKPFRQYNGGVSMATKIFGTLLFKKGKLRGLRHVITPNFGFNYSPDYTNPDWGYFRTVQQDLTGNDLLEYNIFQNNRLSGFETPSTGGRQMALNYGFGNLFEAKIFSKRDSTLKNVKLLNSLNVNGNYNFAADSLQWSQVNVSANQSFFNGISSFQFRMLFDPYDFNRKTGGRIAQFSRDNNGPLLRLVSWNTTLSTALTVGRVRDLIKGVNTDVRVANEPQKPGILQAIQEEDFLSLFEDFRISHSFSLQRRYDAKIGKDTLAISANSIYSSGFIKLTKNWGINVGNIGYDFQSKRVTYPDFTFSRDLHCWIMGISWQPYYNTYSFYIRVKPGKLDFINLPYRKNIQDRR